MVKRTVMLTTVDNPFDPMNQFEDWYIYDARAGHNTCSLMARLGQTSDSLPESVNDQENERIIDEIIADDPFKKYKKLVYNE